MPLDIASFISEVGFPIAAFFMMYRFAVVTLERNTIAIGRLASSITQDQPREDPDWVEEYEEAEPPKVISWPGRRRQ